MSNCIWYQPWNQYESSLVHSNECHHRTSDEQCERHDTGPCPEPWRKPKPQIILFDEEVDDGN